MVNSTSSPTATPPVSKVLFQTKPKSLRNSLPVAEAPRTVLPDRALEGGAIESTVRVTGLVTPWIVRFPIARSLPSAAFSKWLDLKVMKGYFATSKKSAPRRCSSRLALRVLTDAASMVTSMRQRRSEEHTSELQSHSD